MTEAQAAVRDYVAAVTRHSRALEAQAAATQQMAKVEKELELFRQRVSKHANPGEAYLVGTTLVQIDRNGQPYFLQAQVVEESR